MCNKKTIILLIILISGVKSAKILGLFPVAMRSHHILGSALLKELAYRGHEVTMVSPFPLNEPIQNYKDVVLTDVIKLSEETMTKFFSPNTTTIELMQFVFSLPGFNTIGAMDDEAMKFFLELNEKYDVVIQDWCLDEPLLGIGYKLGAKTIPISVSGSNAITSYLLNLPTPYSYVPSIFLGLTDDMTFLQRTLNTLVSFTFDLLYKYLVMGLQKKLYQQYFPNLPPLDDLMQDIDIVLSCSHFTTETMRPTFSNIIPIGSFHLYEKQKLPKDLEIYLNNSQKGVVLLSFGSNVKSENMPKGAEDALLKAFTKLPYNFLWKTNTEFTNLPRNIRLMKWFPQRAILAHPNVKAFITHGGLGGTAEGIFNAVPMIGMPFVGDQHKNVVDSERKGFLYFVDPNKITEEVIVKAVTEVIENPSYKKNINYHSDLYKNLEINPMERAVFWVEHVIKHKGAKHLKPRASQIPFYQYYLLDVISFILIILLFIFFVIYLLIKFLIRKCCKKEKIKKL